MRRRGNASCIAKGLGIRCQNNKLIRYNQEPMNRLIRWVPDSLTEGGFWFNPALIVISGLLMVGGSLARPQYPKYWVVPLVLGIVAEALVVALAQARREEINSEVTQARGDLQEMVDETKQIRNDVRGHRVK